MLGWKRGDNAADDRVCLLIREREEGWFDSRGKNSEKRVLEKILLTGIHLADGRLGIGRGKGIN